MFLNMGYAAFADAQMTIRVTTLMPDIVGGLIIRIRYAVIALIHRYQKTHLPNTA